MVGIVHLRYDCLKHVTITRLERSFMTNVRIGLIGLGNIGAVHIANMKNIEGATLAALCDIDPLKLARVADELQLPAFATHSELLASNTCDAILIAVPHYYRWCDPHRDGCVCQWHPCLAAENRWRFPSKAARARN